MNAGERRIAVAGRIALLCGAFGVAVLASLAEGKGVLVLVPVAAALAAAACHTPSAVRVGRALKPAARGPDRGA